MEQQALTPQQHHLLASIPAAIGTAQEKDWAPVMSSDVWKFLATIPTGLIERHQRHLPIMPYAGRDVLGMGWCRLTDAGRTALADVGVAVTAATSVGA